MPPKRIASVKVRTNPELEVDRKIIGWLNRNAGRGVFIEDRMLCKILDITIDEYWFSIARLNYLGLYRFPMEIFQK